MKRTAERALGIIGLILFVLGGLAFAGISAIQQSAEPDDFVKGFTEAWEEEEGEEVPDEVKTGVEFFAERPYGTYALASFIAAIAGLVSAIVIKKNAILSGILFLGGVVVYGLLVNVFLMILLPLIPMILYLIAGMMALVRKAPQETL
ncbi:DUF4064 domain-containing protein [Shouchella lonarensis]|uniref:DUF4064 domain-containing protein n=1 Tax=Shouchella lonarensis TaxID=1464122 RepID=A0A1G6GV45_9BACI|nr:DUF4064 domain-containing protein [Shouchella lonarensis]SDB85804.1 Protein of unknown function [Shouchella lonarensis]